MINYVDLDGARTLKNKILEEVDSTYQKSGVVNIDTSNLIEKVANPTFDSAGGGAEVEVVPEEIFTAYLNEIFPLDTDVVIFETLNVNAIFNVLMRCL